MILIGLFMGAVSLAQIQKVNLYTKPASDQMRETIVSSHREPSDVVSKHVKSKNSSGLRSLAFDPSQSNLPPSYFRVPGKAHPDNAVVLPAKPQVVNLATIKLGEVIEAEVPEGIIAFPSANTPVRAIVRNGKLKGTVFLGEASLERNSKRITLEFKRLRLASSGSVFNLVASGLDESGILGLEGKYVSGEQKYFGAEFLSALAAGYADASIERTTNAYGQIQDAPTLDTMSKKAASAAMSKTAERFAEKVRSAPEYSVLEGPTRIRLLITEQPHEP